MTDTLAGVISFAYNAAGEMTSLTNPLGKTTSFTYNTLGLRLTETGPLANVKANGYDAAGQRTSYTDARGISQTFTYDANGRLTTLAYPGGSVGRSYDAAGRETSMTDATGTTTRVYDAASRVTSVASAQGTVSYTYNTAGQRASMTLPGSRTVSYAYDSVGRLSTLTDWASAATTFAANTNDWRTAINRPNGVTSAYVYDAVGQATSINHTGPGGAPMLALSHTYDANGNRTATTKNGGTETYTLDPLNRLTGVTYADATVQSYTHDANGNRLTKTQGGTTTTYSYNAGERLVSDGTSTYSYDAAGNLTGRGSDTFSYDYASRMTAATVAGAASTYAYDGDDVRTSVTVGGTTSPQLWDRVCSRGACGSTCGASCGQTCGSNSQAEVPLLLDDGAQGYVWADGLVAEIGSSGGRLDDLGDGLGSVRGWTNAAGTLASTADYDAFGTVRASTGSPGAFRYTGEQWDSSTGFEFLRARYYNPAIGRFTAADTVQPNAAGTQGWNLYAYVANNPTTWVDPTGHNTAGAAAAGPRGPVVRGPLTDSLAPYAVAAGVITGGALAGLGLKLAGGFQLLADIFWMLSQPGRAAFNVWTTIIESPEERFLRCFNNLEQCKTDCHTDYDPDDDVGREACFFKCGAWFALCMKGRV